VADDRFFVLQSIEPDIVLVGFGVVITDEKIAREREGTTQSEDGACTGGVV